MTIYNVNNGIGWASSGVEYAQLYRAKLLRETNEVIKFIFLDFISYENIQTLTKNLGFYDHEIIWLYQYFTDIDISETTFTIDDIINSNNIEVNRIDDEGKIKRIFLMIIEVILLVF